MLSRMKKDKAEIARSLGADHMILDRRENVRDRVLDHIDTVFPPAGAARAHAFIEGRGTGGKLLLDVTT